MAVERIVIQVESRGTRTVKRNLDQVGRSARSTARTLAFLRSALVVVASARVLSNFAGLLDTFTSTSNLLRQITRDTQELNAVQTELFRISQDTRSSFESNVTFFQRLARSTTDLSLSYGELFDITETTSQLLALSGATAQEASNALIQFSQGLAAGALQGEELLSVSEQLPTLAAVIAEEFGVAAGQLRALNEANPGILETERIVKAIADAAPDIAQRFGEAEITISQGFTRIRNALVFFVGQLNSATGASQAFARLLNQVATNIGLVITAIAGLAGVIVFNLLANQVAALTARVIFLSRTILRGLGIAAAGGVKALQAAFIGLNAVLRGTRAIAVTLTIPFAAVGALVAGVLVGAFFLFKDSIDAALESLGGLSGILDTVLTNAIAVVDTIVARWSDLDNAFADIGIQAANAFLRGLNLILVGAERVFNTVLEFVGLERADFGRITEFENRFAGAADSVTASFQSFRQEIEDSGGGLATLSQRADDLIARIQSFTGGQVDPAFLEQLRGLMPDVSGGEGGLTDSDEAQRIEDLTSSLEQLQSAVSPLADATFQLRDANKTLNEAVAEGLITQGRANEVYRRTRREVIGVGNESAVYREKVQLLNEALKDGLITQREFTNASRDLRIEFLDSQTTISAGFERTFLKFRKTAQDSASFIEDSIGSAFRGVTNAVVEFATTGKLEIGKFAQQVQADLLRLVTNQLISQFLGFLVGGAFGGGGGGFFSSLFGGGGGGGFGGAGLGFQGGAGLTGFQNGGTFPVNRRNSVGDVPGVDNRVVAFRANDSEEVEVRKKGEGGRKGGGTVINQNFNITTQDAESFRNSQSQILTKAGAAIGRATRRNG